MALPLLPPPRSNLGMTGVTKRLYSKTMNTGIAEGMMILSGRSTADGTPTSGNGEQMPVFYCPTNSGMRLYNQFPLGGFAEHLAILFVRLVISVRELRSFHICGALCSALFRRLVKGFRFPSSFMPFGSLPIISIDLVMTRLTARSMTVLTSVIFGELFQRLNDVAT